MHELKIALQTNDLDALQTYLEQYPDTPTRADILATIAKLKRSKFSEWTLYEIADKRFPQWMRISSIEQFGDRASVKIKQLADPLHPPIANGKPLPNAAYMEFVNVYDCAAPVMVISEEWIYDKSGGLLFHYKFADPQYLNLSIGGVLLRSGTIASSTRIIACHEEIATPLFSKTEIVSKKFRSLASTAKGDGEIFYELLSDTIKNADLKHVAVLLRYDADHSVTDSLPSDLSMPAPPRFRTEVDEIQIKCDVRQSATTKTEFWNASNELVRMGVTDPEQITFSEFQEVSPLAVLQHILCNKGYAGIGVEIVSNDEEGIKVRGVVPGSPAAHAGIVVDDVITNIDHQPLSGLTFQQILETLRGPVNSKVVITIARKGLGQALEMTLARQNVQMGRAQ